MSASGTLTLSKEERICSKKLMDRLFGGGNSRALTMFPLRAIYMEAEREDGEPPVQILVSVPKRCFKRAVKRNRVKRQVREAYRHQKSLLTEAMEGRSGKKMVIAFIWMDACLHSSEAVGRRVGNLLMHIREQL